LLLLLLLLLPLLLLHVLHLCWRLLQQLLANAGSRCPTAICWWVETACCGLLQRLQKANDL
jgi:hypothetical protein